MNNKLQLKDIRNKIKELKSQKAELKNSTKSSATHKVVINKKGGRKTTTRFKFGGFPSLLLISTIFSYAHKIPILSKILKKITIWYGRTTWLKLILKIRKWFVYLNALILIIALAKLVNFSSDNIIAGCYSIGVSYLQLLKSNITLLWDFFCNILDRIIPRPPSPPSKPSISEGAWRFIDPTHKSTGSSNININIEESLRNMYKHNMNIPQRSYYNIVTDFIFDHYKSILGILVVGSIITLSSHYGIFDGYFRSTVQTVGTGNTIANQIITPETHRMLNPEADPSILGKSYRTLNVIKETLDPRNWVESHSSRQNRYNDFIAYQTSGGQRGNLLYYPFTEYHPYDNISTRWYKHFIGESDDMRRIREGHIREWKSNLGIPLDEINITDNGHPELSRPSSTIGIKTYTQDILSRPASAMMRGPGSTSIPGEAVVNPWEINPSTGLGDKLQTKGVKIMLDGTPTTPTNTPSNFPSTSDLKDNTASTSDLKTNTPSNIPSTSDFTKGKAKMIGGSGAPEAGKILSDGLNAAKINTSENFSHNNTIPQDKITPINSDPVQQNSHSDDDGDGDEDEGSNDSHTIVNIIHSPQPISPFKYVVPLFEEKASRDANLATLKWLENTFIPEYPQYVKDTPSPDMNVDSIKIKELLQNKYINKNVEVGNITISAKLSDGRKIKNILMDCGIDGEFLRISNHFPFIFFDIEDNKIFRYDLENNLWIENSYLTDKVYERIKNIYVRKTGKFTIIDEWLGLQILNK